MPFCLVRILIFVLYFSYFNICRRDEVSGESVCAHYNKEMLRRDFYLALTGVTAVVVVVEIVILLTRIDVKLYGEGDNEVFDDVLNNKPTLRPVLR